MNLLPVSLDKNYNIFQTAHFSFFTFLETAANNKHRITDEFA